MELKYCSKYPEGIEAKNLKQPSHEMTEIHIDGNNEIYPTHFTVFFPYKYRTEMSKNVHNYS
jgi:hypothetical protein